MKPFFEEPTLREHRPDWEDVPEAIVRQLENILKEKIKTAETAWGGFSPSAAFIATLASGGKVFIKGTHPGQDAHGTQMLRQELDAYRAIPFIREISPSCLGSTGDSSEDGWMLAVFEYIATQPVLPWTTEKTARIFKILKRLHAEDKEIKELPFAAEKNFVMKFLKPEGGWLRIQGEPDIAAKFLTVFENENAGKKWMKDALPKLCEKQTQAAELGGVIGILHQDLRSDNILFGADGRAWLADWPNACRGPVALDIAGFLPTVSSESGMDVETLLSFYREITGITAKRSDLAIALASLSGHMADSAYRMPPARLPRLRWMQKCTLWAMLQWAVELIGTPPPPRFIGLRRD